MTRVTLNCTVFAIIIMSFSVTNIIYLSAAEALWKKTRSAARYSHGSRASGELDMECLDSGMVLFRENCTPGEALESSYRQAFGKDFDKDDCFVILSET